MSNVATPPLSYVSVVVPTSAQTTLTSLYVSLIVWLSAANKWIRALDLGFTARLPSKNDPPSMFAFITWFYQRRNALRYSPAISALTVMENSFVMLIFVGTRFAISKPLYDTDA